MINRKEARKRLTAVMASLLLGGTIFTNVCSPVVAESGSDPQVSQDTPVVEVPEMDTPATEDPGTDTPEVETPGADTPDVEVPGIDTPGAEDPGTDVPDVEDPGTDVPDVEDPGTDVPDVEDPETDVPDAEDPGTDTPDVEDPGTDEPDVEDPGTDTPDGEAPGTDVPDAEDPGTDVPDIEDPGTGTPDAEEPEVPAIDTPQPEAPAPETPVPDEETKPSKPVYFRDNHREAYYEERTYDPSEAFVDKGEKIKYSTDMPLENIPAFITPEMIIGALKVQDEYGYPASVTIAQIIQESGFGMYGPYGDEGQGLSYLAYQYNNLFGIKGTGPAGSVNMKTGEQTKSGESYTIRAGFRVYYTYTESIEDRADLLSRVYSDLIEGVNDANTFAMRIGSRWATDINYAENLIRQMETYDLYRLDRMTLGEFSELLGDFADPCPGSHLTSEFGWREFRNSYHKGIDLGTGSENIPVYAAAAGTVVTAGWSDSAGYWIVIDHGDGLVTKYMHHKELYVEEGDKVEKGQQIGLSGSTGDSTGNHLHFQLEINGAAVDPLPYLYPEEISSDSNGEIQ